MRSLLETEYTVYRDKNALIGIFVSPVPCVRKFYSENKEELWRKLYNNYQGKKIGVEFEEDFGKERKWSDGNS